MAADHALAKQLGLKPGIRCWFHNLPDGLRARLDSDALGVEEQATATDGMQCAILCVADDRTLERELAAAAPLLATNGFLWVVHPGDGELQTQRIGDLAAPLHLVLADSCSLGDNWSGLKLIAR
ncbi:DUF3052 domain-containing protein [Sphingomonas sp. IC-56]|uniref:DUF3052 family protein n=1 Tax=Sphingomonas sp. IC-56 TaxID=2898529 RepID=UPI001E336456|nr:DUF3052 family protein [Sphingomonas sp. IC-56]MCD2322627.1 DUF3052 domain-containing protein [Sphingomonas sp. IC-56]